jgi:phenylacetate-CoA ligase
MSYGSSFQQSLYYYAPYFLKNCLASLYGWFQKRERYGKFYHHHLQFLLTSQWYSNAQLAEIQFQKVKQFVLHANQHSRFYRHLFQVYDFHPAKMQSLADLAVLPILKKETIRAQLQEILPDNLSQYRVRWAHTSGTTGTGLQFPLSSECFQREYAFCSLHYLWGNICRGDKLAFCLGHPVAYPDRHTPPFWVSDYANNWLLLSSYHLTEKNLPYYIAALEKFQPDFLSGYPSSIYLLALANQHCGQRVHPRVIYTASETLFDFQRYTIEKSFGCKVFMWYGNSEMCANIVECEKGKYHLKLEHSYVELLDTHHQPVSLGEEGRMICTGFGNYALPLIRYSIEDIVILAKETCACGRGGTIIERVVGRTEDYILTPDGRFVGRLDHLFKDSVHVKLAQIVQNAVDAIIIRIVKDPAYSKRDEQDILNQACLRLGSDIQIHFEYVDEIPRTKNGKVRFIISNVQKKAMWEQSVSHPS